LVVAFVLAFLIRTFQAEAFVIPTGSMAPTLMGRHKDVFCDQCGTRYKVNSSDDSTDLAPLLRREVEGGRMTAAQARARLAGTLCVGGECPQCRYLMLLEDEGTAKLRPSWKTDDVQSADYSGDRLVVSKYAYSFRDPKRWDVAVFKYPGNSQTNYIKRVVGLPGEELRVFQGDLFIKPLGSNDEYEIARKPPEQVMAMRQFVHDTHHEPHNLIDAGWPLAWSGVGGWQVMKAPATETLGAEVYHAKFRVKAEGERPYWLRYRHTPPTENVWQKVLGEGASIESTPEPQLITDFTPYNTRLNLDHAAELRQLSLAPRRRRPDDLGRLGLHWVSDLMVDADLDIESDKGEVSVELVEAGTHYGVTFDVATGEATLWRRAFEAEDPETIATVSTELRGGGGHAVRFANVDDRLLLWVDGSLVEVDAIVGTDTSDAAGEALVPRTSDTDPGDLAPAGIGASNGIELMVNRLRLWRDGYYIAASHETPNPGFTTDITPSAFELADQRDWERTLLEMPEDPSLWYALANRRRVDFPIDEGQLFVMGDNSGWSLDARLWAGGNGRDGGKPGGAYLERSQLVGKAVCVYWPHSWYSVPGTGRRIPIWPNFSDMRLVR
ncbi:MAG: signal peptidase I, partial [Planctomycetota bacterium]